MAWQRSAVQNEGPWHIGVHFRVPLLMKFAIRPRKRPVEVTIAVMSSIESIGMPAGACEQEQRENGAKKAAVERHATRQISNT